MIRGNYGKCQEGEIWQNIRYAVSCLSRYHNMSEVHINVNFRPVCLEFGKR